VNTPVTSAGELAVTTAFLLTIAALTMSVPQGARQEQGETYESPRQRAQRVLASELDRALPAIPIGEWLRSTVQSDREMQWTHTACPATHEERVTVETDRPVCVLITASQRARPGPERPQAATNGELVVAISIRLGRGNPNSGAWKLEQPLVEDAFIERDGDSLSVQQLGEVARLLRLSPRQWLKSELSVSAADVRCDTSNPTPGERVRCQAMIHNRGPLEAAARITVSIVAAGNDIGMGQSIPNQKVPPNGQVVVVWDWVWPQGKAWSVGVSAELHTPHAYGGYRIPIKERNVEDNRAYVTVRAGR
jgi:hypothetical protein